MPYSVRLIFLALLLQLDNWSTFDVFKVAALSHGKPLQKITFALLNHFDLVGKLQLEQAKLASFLEVRSSSAHSDCCQDFSGKSQCKNV